MHRRGGGERVKRLKEREKIREGGGKKERERELAVTLYFIFTTVPAEPSPEEQQQQMFNMLRSMMQQTPTTRSSTAVPQLNSAPQQHSAPLATVAAQPAVTQPAVTFQPSSSAHQPSPDTGVCAVRRLCIHTMPVTFTRVYTIIMGM